jgi:AcrR family transcriptional regulator
MESQRLPRHQRHEEGRARLLKAALGVLSRKGFEGTSVEDICRAAGYSKGGFYFYFRGKEDVLLHLVEELVDGSEDAAPLGGGWSSGLLTELWGHACRSPHIRERLAEYYAGCRQRLREAVREMRGSAAVLKVMADLILALETGLQIQSQLLADDSRRSQAQRALTALLSTSAAGRAHADR